MITCCNGCVPPKRYPGCQDHCPERQEELAQKLIVGRIDPEGVRDELYHTMACKSAIKAGMVSDEKELAALVEKVQSGEIQYCPHGRPVAVKMTKYEIEKMFKRA